jgi:SAM-dependent methyltransferase
MSEETSSIHQFDFNLITDYFSLLERQGPGSPEATLRALSFIDNLTDESRIVDLGCGTGGQTRVLAQNAPGRVTGIDLSDQFIDLFNKKTEELNLQERVQGVVGSMQNLAFQEELDLIWAEGSIYNIGFERGLRHWRKCLKKGGYVAVTEASWLTGDCPTEIAGFWQEVYPAIDSIPNRLSQLQAAGYTPVATFVLPEECWIDNFYIPQVKAQEVFLAKYPDSEAAKSLVQNERHEAQLYQKYKDYYGYVFYIGKKL